MRMFSSFMRITHKWPRFGRVLLAFCIVFAYGVAVGRLHLPPYSALKVVYTTVASLVNGTPDSPPTYAPTTQPGLAYIEREGSPSSLHFPDNLETIEELNFWQDTRRLLFSQRMLYPLTGSVTIDRDQPVRLSSYSQQRCTVLLDGIPEFSFYRLSPHGDADLLPALAVFMGHGYINQLLTDPNSYQRAAAKTFAEAGFIVYVMENIGMTPHDNNHLCIDQALRMTSRGWYHLLFAHQRIMLDEMLSDPRIDKKRIGAAGVSTGGLLALTALVQEPQISAASIQGIFGSMRISFVRDRKHHCSCGAIPGLLPEFDLPEMVLVSMPRSLHIANGEHDGFPPEEASRVIEQLKPIMQHFGFTAPHFTIHPEAHTFDVGNALIHFRQAFDLHR